MDQRSDTGQARAHIAGRGLYIWGDNDPLFVDANLVLGRLFNVAMFGDSYGDQVVSTLTSGQSSGLVPGHLVTTGLVNIYEGITIAEVPTTESLRPLVYGSNGRSLHRQRRCLAAEHGAVRPGFLQGGRLDRTASRGWAGW